MVVDYVGNRDVALEWQDSDGLAERLLLYQPELRVVKIFPKMPLSDGAAGVHGFRDQFANVSEFQFDLDVWDGWIADAEDWIYQTNSGDPLVRGLLDGFGKIVPFGLGLPRVYRGFVRLIEAHATCHSIRFGSEEAEGIDRDTFHVRLRRFADSKHTVDLNRDGASRVASRVNEVETHNLFSDLLRLDERKVTEGHHPVIKAITRAVTEDRPLDADQRSMLVQQMSAESLKAAKEQPKEFGELRRDVELVTLKVLIEQFEGGLDGAIAAREDKWQEFFENNPFALQQLFAAPVIPYGSPHSVIALAW